jgi:hypothetical protein
MHICLPLLLNLRVLILNTRFDELKDLLNAVLQHNRLDVIDISTINKPGDFDPLTSQITILKEVIFDIQINTNENISS